MSGNPAWRFLPTVETAQSERAAIFERANALGSALRVLNDELDCDIPEYSDSKSWKTRCPWEHEHPDGGLDKNCRYYWDADRMYCFADHGVLDLVGLRSLMWSVPTIVAAKRIIERYEESVSRLPWWQRARASRDRLMSAPEIKPMDTQQAYAALHTALRAVEGYTVSQYRPDVRAAVQSALEALDPSWDFEQTLQWLETSTQTVASTLRKAP